MDRKIKLMYFDYSEKVSCPFCENVFTLPRVRDLIPHSKADRVKTDIVLVTEEDMSNGRRVNNTR